MALDIEKIIRDIYSGMSSPSAQWAREGLAKERETALNNEDYRKRKFQELVDSALTQRTSMNNEGTYARQGLANTGRVDVANIGESGLTARQRLSQEFLGGQFDRTHGLAKETADRNYELGGRKLSVEEESAKNTGLSSKLGAIGEAYKNALDPQRQQNLDALMTSLIKPPVAAPQSATIPDRSARSEFTYEGTASPGQPQKTVIPQPTKTGGAQSMEFRQEGYNRPLTKEDKDRYLSMIPGVKPIKKKNIFGF